MIYYHICKTTIRLPSVKLLKTVIFFYAATDSFEDMAQYFRFPLCLGIYKV